MTKDTDKVTRFHRIPRIHIDFILLVFIFIYIVFHAVSYFTGTHIPVTEVKQGQIVSNDHLTALAIRQEKLVTTDASGKAVYIIPGGSVAASGENVLGIDSTGALVSRLEKDSTDTTELTDDQRNRISDLLSNFNDGYSSDTFHDVYLLKQSSSDILNQANSAHIRSTLKALNKDASAGADITSVKAPQSGLVCLSYDNLSDITDSTFTSDTFDESRLKTTELTSGDDLSTGDVAFRLVTDDNWELIAPISASMAEDLKSDDNIEIRFEKDGTTAWATSAILDRSGSKYLCLTLDDSMDRFADSRFLDIELMTEQTSGLKVPDSSILEKILYQIPEKYVTRGGDSNRYGVMIQTSEGTRFRRFSIYQKDDDNNCYWGTFSGAGNDTTIVNSSALSDKLSLKDCEVRKTYGVYLANKGYTQFVQVNILYRNDQYCIIEPVNDNELRLYDHIVLKARGVKDGQMLNE